MQGIPEPDTCPKGLASRRCLAAGSRQKAACAGTEKADFVSYDKIIADNRFVKNLYRWNMFNEQFELLESNKDFKQKQLEQNKVVESILNQIDFDNLPF